MHNRADVQGILLIVDNTLATPYLLNPFEFGADTVVYSATKALSGHGNVIAGIVVESGTFDYANGNYPQFTEALVAWLEQDEYVSWVRYPTATGSAYKELADKYLPKGSGSIVSFGLKGSEEQKRRVLDSVQLFGYQANIGDARSLIINPAQTTHIELTNEARAAVGLAPETIRLSLGLESPKDLIADLKQAFAAAFSRHPE